ncbi:MAG TPA: hypothetical protein DDX39_08640 [Bacteroidales bacterium]|nr:MAG: hypothetical protein A2W98_04655 [Bacteroidetes bacterium GWF2_33_38]OFY73291.1 MAG: hypothetical protein A2265_05435 [Bacteroidetes bacterium RIFOXYA12_FULL_33_9]HBF88694.1 hypothetical protein [Bacteroidales bacterium]
MYKKIIPYFFKQYLFLMLFFVLNRLIFIIYNWGILTDIGYSDILMSFWHALYLDNSAAMYLMVLPFFIILFYSLFKSTFFEKMNRFYFYVIIIVVSIITSSELGIYEEWKIKLNYKAITYMERPDEVFNTAKGSVIFFSFFFMIIQSLIGIYGFNKLIKVDIKNTPKSYLFSVLYFLIAPFIIFYGIRGGFQPIPINQSDVFFSKNNNVNQAAVNSAWNFMHSIVQNKKFINKNPFNYLSDAEAEQIVKKMHAVEKDTTENILSVEKPNIVLIILESWTYDVLIAKDKYGVAAPKFKQLFKEGLFFDNIYATGTVSDQGMAGILSGYPAQPTVSIIKLPQKYQFLPCMNEVLKTHNYSTSYYFGGQLSYGNIKGYIYFNEYDKIIEGIDFDDSIPQGRLGVHDEYLFERNFEELKKEKEPFMSVMFTLSSHSPYDQSLQNVFKTGGEFDDFLTSVYYTDSCLNSYLNEAKTQTWYKNTLFVLVADHSHASHMKWGYHSHSMRKIPLLITGPALKPEYKGKTIHKIFSQIDITSTLLAQLKFDYRKFVWSKNMMNPYTKEFAYYSFDDGIGWIVPSGSYAYDHDLKKYRHNTFADKDSLEIELKKGKAYLQILFKEYLNY